MRPNPLHDVLAFLSQPGWPTPVFWLLLLGSLLIAVTAWSRAPEQRGLYPICIWLLRLSIGAMWWQQSLWKIPPNYDGLKYWMQQMVDHAAVPLQSQLVAGLVLPNITLFGPLVYAVEVFIGVSLLLGLFTRVGALFGLLMAMNLWLGLYSADNEWPWTYFFLLVIQALFLLDSPGRWLGADALLFGRAARIGRR